MLVHNYVDTTGISNIVTIQLTRKYAQYKNATPLKVIYIVYRKERRGEERSTSRLDIILLTKCEVKMAGYWPSSFFVFLWTKRKGRSIKTQKENEPS